MKWTYVLLFSEELMTHSEAKYFLNAQNDAITEWMNVFPGFFLFVSDRAAHDIGELLMEYVKKNSGKEKPDGLYLIMECSDDRDGWLQTVAWNLILHQSTKEPAPPEPPKELQSGDSEEDDIPF